MQVAIDQGLTVLSWYENLPSEEVPPEYLWEDGAGLEQWWERIKALRDADLPISGSRSSSSNEDDEGDDDPGLAENDLARVLKQG